MLGAKGVGSRFHFLDGQYGQIIQHHFGRLGDDLTGIIKRVGQADRTSAHSTYSPKLSLHSFPVVDEHAFESRRLLVTFPHHEYRIERMRVGHASTLSGHRDALSFPSPFVDWRLAAPIVKH